jgi:MraZ protein
MASESRASYTDTFEHAFDAKGRITVPSEWRDDSYEAKLYLVPSNEACVRVYPASWMNALQEKMLALKDGDPTRRKMQELAAMAQGTTWDQQGRIMVKEKLRAGASLKKEAVLVGRVNHFQIWEKSAWEERETIPTTIEEALGALGR